MKNHDTHDRQDSPDLPEALRWQLRALRHDETPATDLWPGIAARLSARTGETPGVPFLAPAPPVLPARPSPMAAGTRGWLRGRTPVALAASVLVAVGTLGLLRHGGPSPEDPSPESRAFANASERGAASPGGAMSGAAAASHPSAGASIALAEAEGLRLQYEGAIRELETRPGAAAPNPVLRTLDQSAELILAALRQAPDSTRLLEQLRRTYQRRVDLMRLPLA